MLKVGDKAPVFTKIYDFLHSCFAVFHKKPLKFNQLVLFYNNLNFKSSVIAL